jgi:hypothetical protein
MAEKEKSVSWEIKENLGLLRVASNGWRKELNIVSWNDGPEKFDIRDWSPDHTRMTKGLTFNLREGQALRDAIGKYLEKSKERETESMGHGYER